jgi:hypothetical protein
VYVRGELHAVKLPPSSAHSKVASDSLEENSKFALVSLVVASGPESIVVLGGVKSAISHENSAGVGSTLPSASLARTKKSCSSNARSVYSSG